MILLQLYLAKLKLINGTKQQQLLCWLKNASDKHKRKFIKFEIPEFYPSISENLLNKSIE